MRLNRPVFPKNLENVDKRPINIPGFTKKKGVIDIPNGRK
jgi:hypothetical protein